MHPYELVLKVPERIAWVFPAHNLSLSFQEGWELVQGIIASLEQRNAPRSAPLALVGGNAPPWVLLREAALLRGNPLVPLAPELLPHELASLLAFVRPFCVFADPGLPLKEALPYPVEPWDALLPQELEGNQAFPPTPPSPLPPAPSPPTPQEGKEILFTSGSSGFPRAVVRSSGRNEMRIAQTMELFRCKEEELHLVTAPLFHSGPALFYGVYRALGAEQWIYPRFDPREILFALTRTTKPVAGFFVPTMARRLIEIAEKEGRKLKEFQHFICAGGPMDPDTRKRLLRLLPPQTLWEFYGTTETGTITVLPPELQESYGHTVGFPLPGVRLEIRNEEGKRLPPGKPGRIYVSTPTLMLGYLEHPERPPVFPSSDGMIPVGDLGELTPEGALILRGRADGVIVSGGKKIQGEEVEAALKSLPGVGEAVVFGIPDPEWGEKVVALVEPGEKKMPGSEELRALLRHRLAPYKIPKEIRYGKIPRTPSGKLLRSRDLLATLWQELTGSGTKEPVLS